MALVVKGALSLAAILWGGLGVYYSLKLCFMWWDFLRRLFTMEDE